LSLLKLNLETGITVIFSSSCSPHCRCWVWLYSGENGDSKVAKGGENMQRTGCLLYC